MPIDTSNIFKKCLPAISTDIDRTGSITTCDISTIQEADFATIFRDGSSQFRDLRNIFASHFNARAYGTESFGFWDLIQMLSKPVGSNRITKKQSSNHQWMIEPYITAERKSIVNTHYWNAFWKADASGNKQVWMYSQHGIPADPAWFPAGSIVFLTSLGPAGDVIHTAWEVAASPAPTTETAGSGAANGLVCVVVELIPQNSASNMPSAKTTLPTVTAGNQLGLAVRGVPNVTDYESYCEEIPAINPTQQHQYWLQSTRYSITEDSQTELYIQQIVAGNDYYKTFQHVPSVEKNRQITHDFRVRQVNSFFFNKPLANQTLAGWGSLQQVQVPATAALNLPIEAKCVGYRANAVGIFEQLAECGRLFDLQGNKLSIAELVDELYNVWRARNTVGVDANVIEVMTDSRYAILLKKAFMTYVQNQAPTGAVTFNYDIASGGADQGPFGIKFFKFALERPAIELRILFSTEFDDILTAHTSAGFGDAGRMVWCIDWSAVSKAPVMTNQVVNETGNVSDIAKVDSTFLCVMDTPKIKKRLFSEVMTYILDSPATSFVIEGIQHEEPDQASAGSLTDLKGAA